MANNVNMLDNMPDVAVRALGVLLSSFEDLIGLDRPLWRDVSRYQGKVDHTISASNGVLGMAARSTISWGYQDPWFPNNWIESKNNGLFRTSYHVLYPGEDVIAQADNWYRVHPEIDVIPRIIDMELQHDLPYTAIADAVWKLSCTVLKRDGVRPIIYSRYLLVNSWLASWTDDMLNAHYWWLAQYLWDRTREHPGPPTIPNRVNPDNVIMHQTADKKAGFPFEVESAAVDYDRWLLGDAADMYIWIANTWGGGPAIPPSGGCDCDERLTALEARVAALEEQQAIDDASITALSTSVINLREQLEDHIEEEDVDSIFFRYLVKDYKTLAFYSPADNDSGYPIISNYIYEPRIRWDQSDVLLATNVPIRADGGSLWYILQPGQNGKNIVPEAPTLYVNANDLTPL